MPEPTAAEVIPKAIVRERISPIPTSSAEKLAKSVIQKADEGAWREAIELARNMPPVEANKIAQKAEQIGIVRGATGQKTRTPEETSRFDEFNDAASLVRKFLERGYDGMASAEKTNLQNTILTETALRPILSAELTALTPAQRIAFAERLLKDPVYASKIKEVLDGILDPERKLIDEQAINNAQDSLKEKEYEKDDKQAEIDDVQRRLQQVDTRLAEFIRPSGGALMGAKAQEIKRIRSDLPRIQAELSNLKNQAQDTEFRLNQLQQERHAALRLGYTGRPLNEIDQEINLERGKLRDVQSKIETRESDINKLPALEQEEQQLEQQKRDLDREKLNRQSEMNKIQLEFQKRQRAVEDLKAVRVGQEQDLVDGMKSVFQEAVNRYINTQVEAISQNYDTELENLKNQTSDQNEKAMHDALKDRWLGPLRTRRKGLFGGQESYRPLDRTKINDDFDSLMTKGPEAVMQELLISRVNPSTGRKYTTKEANEILKNKDYVEKMQPEVVKQLLARRMLTGGIRREDIHIIVNTPWGEGMIDNAIQKNQEFRDAVTKVMGESQLSGRNFFERFGQEMRKRPWLLALLLGIPAALGIAAFSAARELDIA